MKLDRINANEQILINPFRQSQRSVENFEISTSLSKTTDIEFFRRQDKGLDAQRTDLLKISQEELKKLVEELRHKFSMLEKYLKIDIDRELQMPISKIIDMRTEEVIRQIPPDYIVELLRRLNELKGVFVSKEV
ncbi:flagellar protein FlaG [Thermodesulfovibrio hydrogeniphilus]